MGGNFANSHDGKVHYENPVVAAIMSVYWSTVNMHLSMLELYYL